MQFCVVLGLSCKVKLVKCFKLASLVSFQMLMDFAKFNIHKLISIYNYIAKGPKTLTLFVSNIHRLQNANFYSRQIKLVYSMQFLWLACLMIFSECAWCELLKQLQKMLLTNEQFTEEL